MLSRHKFEQHDVKSVCLKYFFFCISKKEFIRAEGKKTFQAKTLRQILSFEEKKNGDCEGFLLCSEDFLIVLLSMDHQFCIRCIEKFS